MSGVRGSSFRLWALGIGILGAVGVLAFRPAPVAGKPAKTPPCPEKRYIVQGGPLLPGAPAAQVDVVTVGPVPVLSVGCDGTHLKGKVKRRVGKRGTSIGVSWLTCGGLSGRVRLSGIVTGACQSLSATLRAKNFKRKFTAVLSTCGDSVLDAGGGEACDPGGVACTGAAGCTSECACATTTTTTTLPAGACNPLTQSGCASGNKCTWIQVADSPETLGRVGCVANGTVAAGGTCTQGAVGDQTGFDNCQAGLVCISNVCQDICGFDGSPAAPCADGYHCTRYANLFANGSDDPVAGACTLGCDPITQLRSDDTPCPASQGCYLLTSSTETIGVCAGAGSLGHGQTITGSTFANSCLPGHMPRRKDQATTTNECGALCRPTDVFQGNNVASEGGVSPDTCESKGAAVPADATSGESCRYYWSRETFGGLSAYSNTVGWCFKHATFLYDSDNDMTLDAAYPRCVTLTTGDVVPPIGDGNDALYFWCVQRAAMLTPRRSAQSTRGPSRPSDPALLLDRIGHWR